MVTEKQLANLRPCSSTHQPLVRGKRGASPLTTLKKYITKQITAPDPFTHESKKMAIGEIIALQWLAKAFKGDERAIIDILDRIDGKSLQKILGEGFNNISQTFVYLDPKAKEDESEKQNRTTSELPTV